MLGDLKVFYKIQPIEEIESLYVGFTSYLKKRDDFNLQEYFIVKKLITDLNIAICQQNNSDIFGEHIIMKKFIDRV